ncbi:MAG: response regulator [Xenococcaceae cyanobacterium MO_188.B29]|nr:response regulator [Xenococcaceae cyanobacterium MO_188.B29]
MNTVMIVEDSMTDMELLTLYLQKEGLSVMSATSGEDAQRKLEKHRPDLIVLDVILPGQSGFQLCRQLKSDPQTKGIPIVLCSTKNTEVDKQWGKMGGADAYITKPVDKDNLLNTIRQFI